MHTDANANLVLAECDGSLSQTWELVGSDPTQTTEVKNSATKGCWEVFACNGRNVDTNYGCKGETPAPLPCAAGACCNMAWAFHNDGSIVSGMNHGDDTHCIIVDTDSRTLVSDSCSKATEEAKFTYSGAPDSTHRCADVRNVCAR